MLESLALSQAHATAFGVEIGGTWMRAVKVETGSRKILSSERLPTPTDPDDGIRQLRRMWEGLNKPEYFGFASAAEVEDGVVTRWPTQPAYVGSNLLAAFSCARAVCLDDASAAAYGEHNHCAQASGSSLYISVGTGVGGGAVLDGKLWQGTRGVAMDIGHVPVPSALAQRCRCGSLGCVQAIASGHTLSKDDGTTEEQRLRRAAQGIGELMLILTRIFDCPLFILGGGTLEAEPAMFESIRHCARRLGVKADMVRGVLGTFVGSVGAAEFASAADERRQRRESTC